MTRPVEKIFDEMTGKWMTAGQIRRQRENDLVWGDMFAKLQEFQKSHGHASVLRSDPDTSLSLWVHAQRNRNSRGTTEWGIPPRHGALWSVERSFATSRA
jgi:hypothetical protein